MISALVVVETGLLVLLVVLVAGLLRSHAEVLRRLGSPDPGAGSRATVRRSPRGAPAAPVSGLTPDGDAVSLTFDGGPATLLAFLSSGCSTCAGFWQALGDRAVVLPGGVQPVVVTRGGDRELPAKLRSLASPGIPVVMSSQAWEEYRVPGAPYFVLVEGTVRGEGTATSWQSLVSLVRDAIAERDTADTPESRSVDEIFAAAGIGPDHPSLRPGGSAR